MSAMDDDFDPYDREDDLDDDCDCIDADLDILTGIERCHICGRSRFLNSEEFTRRLQQEAEWAADYHEATAAEERAALTKTEGRS